MNNERPTTDGLSEEILRRAEFLDIRSDDRDRLHGLIPLYEADVQRFVERFYDHLFEFEETRRFLTDPQLVERLKRSQSDHLRTMLEAQWTEVYLQKRRQVGQAHANIGIDPQWFLGAYNQYVQYYFRRLAESAEPQSRPPIEGLLSVLKVVFLDIGLTLDAYFAQSSHKLRQALDMLWKANVELKHFAQLASHDLKTPLATVANLCDEALDEFGEAMPAGARSLVEAAKNRTFRMSQMIDELLSSNLTSLEEQSNGPVPCGAAWNEAIHRLQPVLDAQQVRVTAPGALPVVWGNRARLQEVFYNLLSNAAKFVAPGTGRIELTVKDHPEGLLLRIADNGPGIPQEALERVFQPFQRLARHRDVPGSGLGLYFTRMMVDQQQGRIWAESEEGQGSQFYLLLRRPESKDD
jgi:signal transduction histidine kinase